MSRFGTNLTAQKRYLTVHCLKNIDYTLDWTLKKMILDDLKFNHYVFSHNTKTLCCTTRANHHVCGMQQLLKTGN
jgi:hypothetical protein